MIQLQIWRYSMYCVIFCQSTHHFSYQERREAAKERKVYEVWTGGGWTGQEKWRLRGQTYFSFCSVVSLFLSDFYSCLFLSVFLQKYSRVLSAEVHIRVERLSELEAAKKKNTSRFILPEAPLSVSATVSPGDPKIWVRGSIRDPNVNKKVASLNKSQSRTDAHQQIDRLTSCLHVVLAARQSYWHFPTLFISRCVVWL